ncbi:hypothetical protein ABEB36_004506 [Hypothenemus hampei]|uniref:DNA polymerase subunit gamma-1 n=1 Tax=Hypothenemus hampei TaxID=57062 RepID=A0ABD1F479_HYPHA
MVPYFNFTSKQELFRLHTWLVSKRFYEIRPSMRKRIFAPNLHKIPNPPKPTSISMELPNKPSIVDQRKNKMGIQMLSRPIYNQVFLEQHKECFDETKLDLSKRDLLKHNMKCDETESLPEVDFKIPPLKGKNIEEHFYNIGNEQIKVYKDLMTELLKGIPKPPSHWLLEEGWTRYEEGKKPEKVDFPIEKAIVFDVEVCMRIGKTATLATAVSNKAWYSWISPMLINGTSAPNTNNQYHVESLVPLESTSNETGLNLSQHHLNPKIVVGHNVSFDRARIKEQYWLNKSGTRFVDTMSLHICVSGLTSYQRTVMKSEKFDEDDDIWKESSSLNNLVDVYKLYCDKKISKDTRNIFIQGTLADIKEDFQNVMNYCCGDVKATYEIFQVLYPIFLERFPHPVTLAGMLELGMSYLPINQNWNRYISDAEQAFEDLEKESQVLLSQRANLACQMAHDNAYKRDIWFWDEDWDTKYLKMKKPSKKSGKQESVTNLEINEVEEEEEEGNRLEEKFKELWTTKDLLPKVRTILPGYPNWYRKLCTKPSSSPDWVPGPHLLSTSMKITPKLLSLTWEGYPLHYIQGQGWGFLIPFSDDLETEKKLPLRELLKKCPLLSKKPISVNGKETMANIVKTVDEHLSKKEYYSRLKQDKTGGLYKGAGVWCNIEVEDCCWFFKLPHKHGTANNVGNPLAKDFLIKFSENVLSGDSESAEKVLTIARNLSYWRNNRARIFEQMIVWFENEFLPKSWRNAGVTFGAIIPQVVVCGTLTRRAMEPTWMTASNAHSERVGSELKAMVQAPMGYNIVGADVDSQELWIASILGDAYHAKMHGCTPLGWMTLSGTKSDKTDMHSVTAHAVGISRDHAKVINYARIYGAGQQFAERLLSQFNPSMSESEARSKAQKMFALTKGKKLYRLKSEFISDLPDQPYGKWQAFQIAKQYGKTLGKMFHESKWIGGTESAMFNRLEEIASDSKPQTPFLGGRLTRALESDSDRFMTTRVNWVVQSGAVDFLHLMLTCMKWIMGDKVRFCISFHDEVRYLVPEQYKYQAALALHVSNLLTRSYCSHKLGLYDLPQAVAFFSSVEVDTVLRKECDQECGTPSNLHGLEKGYGIGKGEALNIYQAVEKAGGRFDGWYNDDAGKKQTAKRLKRSS